MTTIVRYTLYAFGYLNSVNCIFVCVNDLSTGTHDPCVFAPFSLSLCFVCACVQPMLCTLRASVQCSRAEWSVVRIDIVYAVPLRMKYTCKNEEKTQRHIARLNQPSKAFRLAHCARISSYFFYYCHTTHVSVIARFSQRTVRKSPYTRRSTVSFE